MLHSNIPNEDGLIFSKSFETKNLNRNLKAKKLKTTTSNVRIHPYTLTKFIKSQTNDEDFNKKITTSTISSANSTLLEFITSVSSRLNSCINSLIKSTRNYFKFENRKEDNVENESQKSNIKVNKLRRWTCFVCLNKNINLYCSLCGSVKTSSSMHCYTSTIINTNSYSNEISINFEPKKISNLPVKWLCLYCDYANDNFKITCCNCNAPKNKSMKFLK